MYNTETNKKQAEIGKVMRGAYLLLGLIMLVLGGIGVVLPILPTTPFIFLASYFFAKSSDRLHLWLKNTKVYQKNVQPLIEGRGIPLKGKIYILAFAWFFLLLMFFKTEILLLKVLAISLGSIKTIVFFRMKTAKEDKKLEYEG
ncbi:DUF454 family protein [Alkalibaculum sp. M08DMB]|uniref:DUF454 family protein n=1 Tax=Alkalibaculum sporogenes TaxID=2655001 RepID=A0A6A7K4G4_9FIRM|nr:YbaN family protein [Alkalibaculum sporogenes]MPW24265.1 DUF454 family protein [Alkalibaculum sporogenes]